MHGGVRGACGWAALNLADRLSWPVRLVMRQLPPIDPNRLTHDRRRDGCLRHHDVRRSLAFIAEEGPAIRARHESPDLPERAPCAPLGVQLGGHAPAERILALTRLPPWQSASPLAIQPPRETRFGSRLALSRVHWVQPVLVAEITYLTWADDGLLRHTVFVGLRDDKPPREVRRERPS
jgi:hypothetical protein